MWCLQCESFQDFRCKTYGKWQATQVIKKYSNISETPFLTSDCYNLRGKFIDYLWVLNDKAHQMDTNNTFPSYIWHNEKASSKKISTEIKADTGCSILNFDELLHDDVRVLLFRLKLCNFVVFTVWTKTSTTMNKTFGGCKADGFLENDSCLSSFGVNETSMIWLTNQQSLQIVSKFDFILSVKFLGWPENTLMNDFVDNIRLIITTSNFYQNFIVFYTRKEKEMFQDLLAAQLSTWTPTNFTVKKCDCVHFSMPRLNDTSVYKVINGAVLAKRGKY